MLSLDKVVKHFIFMVKRQQILHLQNFTFLSIFKYVHTGRRLASKSWLIEGHTQAWLHISLVKSSFQPLLVKDVPFKKNEGALINPICFFKSVQPSAYISTCPQETDSPSTSTNVIQCPPLKRIILIYHSCDNIIQMIL